MCANEQVLNQWVAVSCMRGWRKACVRGAKDPSNKRRKRARKTLNKRLNEVVNQGTLNNRRLGVNDCSTLTGQILEKCALQELAHEVVAWEVRDEVRQLAKEVLNKRTGALERHWVEHSLLHGPATT